MKARLLQTESLFAEIDSTGGLSGAKQNILQGSIVDIVKYDVYSDSSIASRILVSVGLLTQPPATIGFTHHSWYVWLNPDKIELIFPKRFTFNVLYCVVSHRGHHKYDPGLDVWQCDHCRAEWKPFLFREGKWKISNSR